MKTYTVIYEVEVEIDDETINELTDPDNPESLEDNLERYTYSVAGDLLMDGVYCDSIST